MILYKVEIYILPLAYPEDVPDTLWENQVKKKLRLNVGSVLLPRQDTSEKILKSRYLIISIEVILKLGIGENYI